MRRLVNGRDKPNVGELFSQSTMSTRVTNAQFSNIAGRLNALRSGGTSAGAGGRVAYSDPYGDPGKSAPTFNQVSLSGGGPTPALREFEFVPGPEEASLHP